MFVADVSLTKNIKNEIFFNFVYRCINSFVFFCKLFHVFTVLPRYTSDFSLYAPFLIKLDGPIE